MSKRKIFTITNVHPEDLAYAFAMTSRSPESFEKNLKNVLKKGKQGTEKFFDDFYFKYGHKSIADMAHIPMAFDGISQIAAWELEEETLWDGQEKSTRFQSFLKGEYYVPENLTCELKEEYHAIVRELFEGYEWLYNETKKHYALNYKKPEDWSEKKYDTLLNAKSFDVARYFLFNGLLTTVVQITSARTLEKQINRMFSHPFLEIREIAKEAQEAAIKKFPFNPKAKTRRPLGKSLVKYTGQNNYLRSVYPRLKKLFWDDIIIDATREISESLSCGRPEEPRVDLIYIPNLELSPIEDIVLNLLYYACGGNYSFRELAEFVKNLSKEIKLKVLAESVADRKSYDELIKEFNASGRSYALDILWDRGALRDLHRHRNCIRVSPPGCEFGYAIPKPIARTAIEKEYRERMNKIFLDKIYKSDISLWGSSDEIHNEVHYILPFAALEPMLMRMDLGELIYILELRTKEGCHFSYADLCFKVWQQLSEIQPEIADICRVTDPDDWDFYKR